MDVSAMIRNNKFNSIMICAEHFDGFDQFIFFCNLRMSERNDIEMNIISN